MSAKYTQIVAAIRATIQEIEQVGVYNEETNNLFVSGAHKCVDLAEVDEMLEDFVEIVETESETKLAAMATLYLGIMIASGVVAAARAVVPARAIEVIRMRVAMRQEAPVAYASGVALSALGDLHAVQIMHMVMRNAGLTTRKQFDSIGIAAVVTNIAKT